MTFTVRVLYVDTDQAGVVHHATYLRYLEAARIEHWRARGFSYREFEARTRLGLPIVEAHLRYRAPARFDEVLAIRTSVTRVTRARVVFAQAIERDGTPILDGTLTLACVRFADEGVASIPEEVRRVCELG